MFEGELFCITSGQKCLCEAVVKKCRFLQLASEYGKDADSMNWRGFHTGGNVAACI